MACKLKKTKKVLGEAQFIKESKLTLKMVKVFIEEIPGTAKEKKEIQKLQKTLPNEFYIAIIYCLTHVVISSENKAKELFDSIRRHEKKISKKLARSVGIEVASMDYAKNIAEMIDDAGIIENKKLRKIATHAITDDTTGVYDKKLFHQRLEEEVRRALRHKRPLALLFCDIDEFKMFNDRYGHEVGDEILKKIAHILGQTMRAEDYFYRYGGEEFVCLLPETDSLGAQTLANRIRNKIKNIPIKQKKQKQNPIITISIGGASLDGNRIKTPKQLLKKADQMMYKAKENGKDQVCYFKKDTIKKSQKGKRLSTEKKRNSYSGMRVSQGIARGTVFVYKDILSRDLVSYSIADEQINHELYRIHEAIEHVKEELQLLKDSIKSGLTKEQLAVFEVHALILQDATLLSDIETEIKRELINAEHVVKNVFRKWSNKFKMHEDEMVQTKADDIEDLSRRVLRVLLGYDKNILEQVPPKSIVVAKRLLPSDTVNMDANNVKGIILAESGYNSHSAILARSLDIPAIAHPSVPLTTFDNSDPVILNADSEIIIHHPHKEDHLQYRKKIQKRKKEQKKMLSCVYKEVQTKDGQPISVYANASSEEEFKKAKEYGAENIGLFRVEELYLSTNIMPNREYLVSEFEKRFQHVPKMTITVRLLDIGADKNLPYLQLEDEIAPQLGMRGVRLLLKHDKILRSQLRALFVLSEKYRIRLMIPFVTLPDEVKKIHAIMDEEAKKYTKKTKNKMPDIPLGAMIETPAAVLHRKKIIQVSDFISVGTNDLIQYTMAAGRENSSVLEYYKKGIDIIWNGIREIIHSAQEQGKECSICGEIAGDVESSEKLLKAGVTVFSITPHLIPQLKERLREIVACQKACG